MSTAEQIKSLIRSHFNNDSERFNTIVLQVAAHEARQGHSALAREIRDLLDLERKKARQGANPFSSDLQGLVRVEDADTPRAALVIPHSLSDRVERIIHEYQNRDKLKSHGLEHRRKILLVGPPGTGKTMTAHVLARELHLRLYTIQMDRLVTKFMGETSAKLRLVFDFIQEEHGAFLFDEFDAIGSERSLGNDVGEMRRILSSFLQFVDQNSSDSLVIAATNNPRLLDQALFRRFDDVLYYVLPGPEERKQLIANILGMFLAKLFEWEKVLSESEGLSHAEIDQACRDAIKSSILTDRADVTSPQLLRALKERRATHKVVSE